MLGELGSLAPRTRDDSRYWDQKPRDHNGAGLFVYGPQEKRPSWPYRVRTGSGNRAPSTESRGAALARIDAEKRSRLHRMSLGVTGAFTGRNRRTVGRMIARL
jgi:hypothetical protein